MKSTMRRGGFQTRPYRAGCILALLTLSACGEKGDFAKARFSERLGPYATALRQYEDYWKLHSRDPRAPEAIYRMGDIYRKVLNDHEKARRRYRNVMEWYPDSPWAERADVAFIDSPDYFPFRAGVRTLGDSLSGGENARTLETYTPDKDSPNILQVKREVYAGDVVVSATEFKYEKKGCALKETPKAGWPETLLLMFPALKGMEWESVRDGKRMLCRVESVSEKVEVKAGKFTDCLKLSERAAARPTFWKVQYFAPGIGLVLVSQGTEKKETRILELLSLEKSPSR